MVLQYEVLGTIVLMGRVLGTMVLQSVVLRIQWYCSLGYQVQQYCCVGYWVQWLKPLLWFKSPCPSIPYPDQTLLLCEILGTTVLQSVVLGRVFRILALGEMSMGYEKVINSMEQLLLSLLYPGFIKLGLKKFSKLVIRDIQDLSLSEMFY